MRRFRAVSAAAVAIVLVGLTPGWAAVARATEPPVAGTMMATGDAAAAATPVAAKTMATSKTPAAPKTLRAEIYRLRLYQLHTGESLDVVYRIGDEYVPSAIEKLNYLLRDYRTDVVTQYDLKEFDLLHTIMARLGRPNGVIDIVCGYRTPETNALLRHGTAASGVAENSQHMQSRAIDIRVPGVTTARLRNTALRLEAGGVGYYPQSRFVHVDVGPVRSWSFGERSFGERSFGERARARGRMHRAAQGHRARRVVPGEGE